MQWARQALERKWFLTSRTSFTALQDLKTGSKRMESQSALSKKKKSHFALHNVTSTHRINSDSDSARLDHRKVGDLGRHIQPMQEKPSGDNSSV